MVPGWRCAAVKTPSGGAKDTTPPAVVSVNPPGEAINIAGGTTLRIEFSEYVDRKTVASAFHLQPLSDQELTVEYDDDAVEVTLPDSLLPDQTYVITISRSLKDERGVELAEAVHLAYSTGDRIEKRQISGRVDFSPDPMVIHLWDLSRVENSDTIFAAAPHYITESADDGNFRFRYLRPGEYQILALDRAGTGLPLMPERFAYGVFHRNLIDLSIDSLVTNVRLPVQKEPEHLALLRGEWAGRRWGRLFFNNPLAELPAGIILRDDSATVIPGEYRLDPLDSSQVIIVAADTIGTDRLSLTVQGARDRFRQVLDSISVAVRRPTADDTTTLKLVRPANDQKFSADKLLVQFSADRPIVDWGGISIWRQDTIRLPVQVTESHFANFSLMITGEVTAGENITARISGDSLVAIDSTTLSDSLLNINLPVVQPVGRGGLTGEIPGLDPPIGLRLSRLENSQKTHYTFVNSDLHFEFESIPEGLYQLMVFRDLNLNQKFDFGSGIPFRPGEWFYFSTDTIEIRANWIIDQGVLNPQEGDD